MPHIATRHTYGHTYGHAHIHREHCTFRGGTYPWEYPWEYPGIPGNTREYPGVPVLPGIPASTQNTLRMLEKNKFLELRYIIYSLCGVAAYLLLAIESQDEAFPCRVFPRVEAIMFPYP